MQTLFFIKEANVLINDLKEFMDRRSYMPYAEEHRIGNILNRRVGQLFAQLQNPTIPTAYRLRDVAEDAGMEVDRNVRSRLSQFENLR